MYNTDAECCADIQTYQEKVQKEKYGYVKWRIVQSTSNHFTIRKMSPEGKELSVSTKFILHIAALKIIDTVMQGD